MESVAVDRAGMASALTGTVRSVAQLLGVLVFETVFSEILGSSSAPWNGSALHAAGSPDALGHAFGFVFLIGAVSALLSIAPFLISPHLSEEATNNER